VDWLVESLSEVDSDSLSDCETDSLLDPDTDTESETLVESLSEDD